MSVVTISRTPASYGDEVARVVAQRLGYRLIERADLVRLASEIGGAGAWERTPELGERAPSFWERMNEERRRYASVLRSAVLRLASEDDVVIVGLGAGQLLRNLHSVLRVQVVAPTGVRIDRILANGLGEAKAPSTRDQARQILLAADRESAGYIRYLFNVDMKDPEQWDLVLNTGRFSAEEAAEMVVAAIERQLTLQTPSDERRLADLSLASRVESALFSESSPVWVSGLKVTGENGMIILDGEVIADEDRELAEQTVRAVEGVVGVDNQLRIQPPPLTGI